MSMNTKVSLTDKLRAWFYRQPSSTRSRIKQYSVMGGVGLVILGLYYMTGQDEKNAMIPETEKKVEKSESNLIQDDVVATLQPQIDQTNQKIDLLADAIKKGEFSLNSKTLPPPQPESQQPETPQGSSGTPPKTDPQNDTAGMAGGYPGEASFPAPASYSSNDTANAQTAQETQVQPTWAGEIYEDSTTPLPVSDTGESQAKKDNIIQLPVGFMKARLLVGANALTGEFGSDNPQTVMLRVQTPAQLPNFIKMNLVGCFVPANISGNLSSERIVTLPVSMNCITKAIDGKKYVVEGPVKGFVSDKDGKRDMSARLVTRSGTLLASAVLAKSVEGFGQFVSTQGATQGTSALGTVTTFQADQLAKSSAAAGVGGGATEVSRYLLKFAEQMAPTLETGAGKEITLFIQETATLEIKEISENAPSSSAIPSSIRE